MFCPHCKALGKTNKEYSSHFIRKTKNDIYSILTCPELVRRVCKNCPVKNHTWDRCPLTKKQAIQPPAVETKERVSRSDEKPNAKAIKETNKNRFLELTESDDDDQVLSIEKTQTQYIEEEPSCVEENKTETPFNLNIDTNWSFGDMPVAIGDMKFQRLTPDNSIGFVEFVRTKYDWAHIKHVIEKNLDNYDILYTAPVNFAIYSINTIRGIHPLNCLIRIFQEEDSTFIVGALHVRSMLVLDILGKIQEELQETTTTEEPDTAPLMVFNIPESISYPTDSSYFNFDSLIEVAKPEKLTLARIHEFPSYEHTEMIGEEIYAVAYQKYQNIAGKLTGILLDLDMDELYSLLENETKMLQYIEEANEIYKQAV
jgi:hypothetical protein